MIEKRTDRTTFHSLLRLAVLGGRGGVLGPRLPRHVTVTPAYDRVMISVSFVSVPSFRGGSGPDAGFV
jgi:uncharacterized membrane protein YsdA (DUF1294 family)